MRLRKENKAVMPDFHEQYLAMRATKEGANTLLDLTGVLTELLDLMVSTPDTYLTIGLSRDGGKILATFTEGGLKRYAPATDLDSLIKEFEII